MTKKLLPFGEKQESKTHNCVFYTGLSVLFSLLYLTADVPLKARKSQRTAIRYLYKYLVTGQQSDFFSEVPLEECKRGYLLGF